MSRKTLSATYRLVEFGTRLSGNFILDWTTIVLLIVIRNDVYLMHGREMRAAGCPCPSRCGGGEITANACRKKSCLWLTK